MSALAVGLVGCGGGGGGSSGSSGGGGSGKTFSLSPDSMSFVAAGNSPFDRPNPQVARATVTGVKSGTLFINAIVAGSAVEGVFNVTATSTTGGTADIYVLSPDVVGAGDYSSVVTVRACITESTCSTGQLAGSPQTINVTYKVHGVKASAASFALPIGDSPVASDYVRTFVASGATGDSWTAATNVSWLSVSPTSGTGGTETTITATLDSAQIDLKPNGSYAAAITLTPTSGHPVVIPVTVDIARAQVDSVNPYVGTAGRSESVIVRGLTFVTRGVNGVSFGDVPATSYTVVSDTELRVTHGALAAGRYSVTVTSSHGTARTLAELVVIDPPAGSTAALPYPDPTPGQLLHMFYDAERKTLLVQILRNGPDAEIDRYSYGPSGWALADRYRGLLTLGLSLTGDGKYLIGTINGIDMQALRRMDPLTLANLEELHGFRGGYGPLARANDGVIVMTGSDVIAGYFEQNRTFVELPPVSLSPRDFYNKLAASADGSKLVIGKQFGTSTDPYLEYDPRTRQLVRMSGTGSAQTLAIDRHGTRIYADGKVMDGSYAVLGTVEGASAAALSPDGTRLYTCCDASDKLHVFDLKAPPVGGQFPEIGTGLQLPTVPSTRTYTLMQISPDGGTLFVGAQDLVAIVPAP